MNSWLKIKAALFMLLGIAVGLVAAVAYGGPVGMPIVGLLLASVLVAAGAVSVTATWNDGYGMSYAFGVIAVTLFVFFAPPGEDSVVMVAHWVSYAWIALSILTSLGGVWATARYRRKHEHSEQAEHE